MSEEKKPPPAPVKPSPRVNPIYMPAKRHFALTLLKKVKSQRELFILGELMRRPYS